MEDYTKDPQFLLYGKDIKRNPNTLAELSQIIHQKQAFLKSRKELFSKPKADIRLPETPLSKRSKSSFLFLSNIPHLHICGQFSWHIVVSPMHFICSKAKENENIGFSNGLAPGKAY